MCSSSFAYVATYTCAEVVEWKCGVGSQYQANKGKSLKTHELRHLFYVGRLLLVKFFILFNIYIMDDTWWHNIMTWMMTLHDTVSSGWWMLMTQYRDMDDNTWWYNIMTWVVTLDDAISWHGWWHLTYQTPVSAGGRSVIPAQFWLCDILWRWQWRDIWRGHWEQRLLGTWVNIHRHPHLCTVHWGRRSVTNGRINFCSC